MLEAYLILTSVYIVLALVFMGLDIIVNVPHDIRTPSDAKERLKIYGLILLALLLWPLTLSMAIIYGIFRGVQAVISLIKLARSNDV